MERYQDKRSSSHERGGGDEMGDDANGHGDYMDVELSRESRKQMSKERKRKRERSKEREKESRLESRDRRMDDRYHEKDRDRTKERIRDREREKDHDKDLHKDKERDSERVKDKRKMHDNRDKDLEREKSYDRDHERSNDFGKSKGRDYGREKDERDNDLSREYEHRSRDRDNHHNRDRVHERSKPRERDHDRELDRELERDRGKEKDHDKEKTRDKEREKNRVMDKDRERDRRKERDGSNERESDRDKDKLEKNRRKEYVREKDVEKEHEYENLESKHGRGNDVMMRIKMEIADKATRKIGNYIQDEPGSDKKLTQLPASNSEILGRVMKMKEERLKKEFDGDSEILSWVSKSRRLEEKRNVEKEKAARLSKVLEEQDSALAESENEDGDDPIGKGLAGVKILHGLDKVIEGGTVVLTLKDQGILADGDVNEDIDKLENVEIGEQKLRDDAYRAAKKKPGIYADKFSEDSDSRKGILPQYDDPVEDEGVTLDETGHFRGEAEKKLAELRRRLEGSSTDKRYEDLSSSGKVTSEYYTPEEMIQFKKPKKKKSMRKKEKLDLDALEAEAIMSGLGAGDLRSRKDSQRQATLEEKAIAEAEVRRNAYQSAYAKAEEASKALRYEQTLIVKTVEENDPVFGEDYDDLQRSLEQARKIVLKNQDDALLSGPQAVALLASSNEHMDIDTSSTEAQGKGIVITEMEEFVLGLQTNEEGQNPRSGDVFTDEDDDMDSTGMKLKEDTNGGMEVKVTDTELPNEDKEDVIPDEIIHEPAVGKGLSGVLKLLEKRGILNEDDDWGGRSMDKKKSKLVGINDAGGQKEIRIERIDEFGRILTPKESFRLLSHKFHGKGPGKMKQEKRQQNYQKDLQTKQMKASDTPLHTMEKIREAQAQLKTPYLVLSGNVKPGQTSDPERGFATVEKDHLGSLTPMLGDKKVEHFLGIDRKSNLGNMRPPLPRPPKRP